ncbi:MAG: hypothetical protein ACI4PL_02345 [Faecousia sp.]
MLYPILQPSQTTRQMVDTFRGYNHNLRIADGEFYEMQNMTSDFYPVLSPRGKRGIYKQCDGLTGIIAKDQLCYVDGSKFVIGETEVEMGLEAGTQKELVSMGAYVIILPDKKYINTINTDDRGDIEAEYVSPAAVTFRLCSITGEAITPATVGAEAPESPSNGAMWMDTSATPNALKQYSESSGMWVSVASTYIRIECSGIGEKFQKYDAVEISGVKSGKLQDLNASMVIWDKGADFVVVAGIVDQVVTQSVSEGTVKLERRMPNMDFIVESENRLWGCRYGLNRKGETVNEIYASKLGDFRNWSCYMGLSTDSYAASCGTDGAFTGAAAYMGNPVFFKETCLHKVYGNYPANFQIQTTACRGVQKGSHRSLAVVNEVLYYKSGTAVCAYDGSIPTEISYCLGAEQYKEAIGGALGNKYYISMMDSTGKAHLFVWDTAKKLWHREDSFRAAQMEALGGTLYALEDGTGKIWDMTRAGDNPEGAVKWSVNTGEIGLEMPDMKYLARMIIRMSLDAGTEVRIYARYDFSQDWEPLFAVRSTRLRSFDIPVRAKRCDYMQLRIEGDGPGKIYSITKTIQQGSGRS